ncbi:hypothetical protein EUTSA_v10014216mg [Eutrema salsugineum]|uniref:Uncharacterized protein n=2 Tax=Eutrema salsugineum TaxID=72664 RepID=V4N8V8_EUTSA|nr:hypothetical protein EUTSA_v10014216mg [Eutrema salsugineum]
MVRSNKQEPRVSATYIRSLVKQQLASSTANTMTTTTDTNGGKTQTQTQTQTHKKQVRRRLHTSRPYQERLLNMAEARREIVTALKQHRASMRQAAMIPPPPPPPPQNLFSAPPPPPPPDPFSWTNPHLNLLLPNQPLGLNLNFQDFNDFIQTSSASSSSSSSSTSSSSSNSSSSSIFTTNPHIYSSPSPPPPTFAATSDSVAQPRKQLMEPENDVVTSGWWSELMMKTVEPEIIKAEDEVVVVEDDVFPKFSDVMEFPSWLNQTEEELFHPYNLTDYSSPHNPPLSCMEIGEIEGTDGDDWLA